MSSTFDYAISIIWCEQSSAEIERHLRFPSMCATDLILINRNVSLYDVSSLGNVESFSFKRI